MGEPGNKILRVSSNTSRPKFGKTQVNYCCLKYSLYSVMSIREHPEYFPQLSARINLPGANAAVFPKMRGLKRCHDAYILKRSQCFLSEFMQPTSLWSLLLFFPWDQSIFSPQPEIECSLTDAFQNLCTYQAEFNFNSLSYKL